MKTNSYSPDAYMVFYPFKVEDTLALNGTDNLATNELIVKKEIIALDTYKPKTGIGSWEVTLSSAKDFGNLISPGNWCLIYMSDQNLSTKIDTSENSGLKMIGLVKSIRIIETVDGMTGNRTLRYKIAGEDFHTILNSQIYINATLKSIGQGQELIDAIILLGNKFKTIMSPNEIVSALLVSLLGESRIDFGDGVPSKSVGARAGMPFVIPPAVTKRVFGKAATQNRFVNFLNQNLQKKLIGKINLQPETGSRFTVWSLMDAYAHRILNELYTDLMPVKTKDGVKFIPTLVLRALPFSTNNPRYHKSTLSIQDGSKARSNDNILPVTGNHLYTSKFISEDEIVGIDYGKSDHERHNFFLVTLNQVAEIPESEILAIQRIISLPGGINNLGDRNSIGRYGLKPFIVGSSYLVPLQDADDLGPANQIVRDIWRKAHLLRNGTVMIKGSANHIPVGTNIQFSARNWIAHVEGVGYSFGIDGRGGKTYRTTINFVRLQNLDGTPLDVKTDGPSRPWVRGASSSNGDN